MQIKNITALAPTDLLILPIRQGSHDLELWLAKLPIDLRQTIPLFSQDKDTFKLGQMQFFQSSDAVLPRILLVGLGAKTIENYQLFQTMAKAGQSAVKHQLKAVTLALPVEADQSTLQLCGTALAWGAYRFDKYKHADTDKTYAGIQEIHVLTAAPLPVLAGQITLDAVQLIRDLVNEPSNVLTPQFVAAMAIQLGKETGFQVTVLDHAAIVAEKMGGLLAVSQGSKQEPQFVVLEYGADFKDSPTVALVGKGITFDSGGISLKPGKDMHEMKMDMAGAATVLGTIYAAALNQTPIHLLGLLPLTDNMPGSKAYKPGDIITCMDGTSVEILNTDAEGRLVLADALTYARRFQPDYVIDLATLTGACIVALGHEAAGLMTNQEALKTQLCQAAAQTGERLWPLPLWPEYDELLQSTVADMANIASKPIAGASIGGAFLAHFAKDMNWAHLDIAGVAFGEDALSHGATGYGLRLLLEFFTILLAPASAAIMQRTISFH